MHLSELDKIQKILGFSAKIMSTDCKKWIRVFVRDSHGVQVGRLNFHNNYLHGTRSYKKFGTSYKLDETDFIFFRLARYRLDKVIIPRNVYNDLAQQAETIVEDDYRTKQKWRNHNPVKPKLKKDHNGYTQEIAKFRRKLQKKCIGPIMLTLVLKYKKDQRNGIF